MAAVSEEDRVGEEGPVAVGKRKTAGSLLLAVLLGMITGPVGRAGEIPPVPAIDGSGKFVHDLAGVLYIQDVPEGPHKTIYDAQKTAFEEHDTPIIVVTIHHMAAFGYEKEDIQPFAEKWFNKWQIGTLNKSVGGHNRGILLMVSVGDRKGRIELGADWGRRFDGTCQQIMDNVMIPHFKQGDYASGIAAGVETLGKMAAVEPEGDPESLGLGPARTQGGGFDLRKYSWLSRVNFFLMIAGGLGLILLGVVTGSGLDLTAGKKKVRFWLIVAGVVTIIISIVTPMLGFLLMWLFVYVPLKLLELLCGMLGLRARFFGGGGYSGGGYSGGGYSGGYSGGGGASGSW